MGDRPITEPPLPGSTARFADGFAPRSLLTVDTEEEFDWSGSFSATDHGLFHVTRLKKFQEFCENIGVIPVYLCDWPIATSEIAVEILGEAVARGTAEIGIQLHPWVNPPHDEDVTVQNSFAGNLPPELERAKFMKLRDELEKRFGAAPLIYRAGRYGLGANTANLLKEFGIAIDTSVRSNFDYRDGHGPDYSGYPLEPYWVDADRQLLELPITTVFWGMLRKQGRQIQQFAKKIPIMSGVLSRLGMLERIALTPEGVTAREAIKGIDIALDDGLPLLVLSFHSPSLAPGFTPYVRNEDELDALYDWFRTIYAYLDKRGVKPTSVKELMRAAEN